MTLADQIREAMEAKPTPGPWVVMKWGDGSNMPGFANVTAMEEEVMLAAELPEEDARLIALAPTIAEEYLKLREAADELARAAESFQLSSAPYWQTSLPNALAQYRNLTEDT